MRKLSLLPKQINYNLDSQNLLWQSAYQKYSLLPEFLKSSRTTARKLCEKSFFYLWL